MDRITTGLLDEFCKSFELKELNEDAQFEHLATYLTVRRHYSETSFDPTELVTGSGGDTGIDGIAIVVNNSLVTDIDEVEELLKINGYLEVSFIFVQAERTAGFDTAKIGQFGFGVHDFFGKGTLPRNDAIKNSVEIMNALFKNSGKFTKGNPSCYLYYVTTGRWLDDANLVARYKGVLGDLEATGNFSRVEFLPIGADQLQKLYNESKNAITREFVFDNRTVIPDIANVREAHLGYMGASEFLKLVCDDDGKIIESLFYENVTFATNRLSMVLPIVEGTRSRLKTLIGPKWTGPDAADEMAKAYAELFHKEFVSTRLRQYGYESIEDFRREGRNDLGDHFFNLCIELDRFDLYQTSFLFFGHDNQKNPKLFQIDNPGHVIDQNHLKFAVIGSGHDMAMASLRWPPPLNFLLEDTIYRLLEAKFSAETATGVGKRTTVVLRNRDGRVAMLSLSEIDEIRKIWKKEVADVPSPLAAIELLEKSHAVRDVAGER